MSSPSSSNIAESDSKPIAHLPKRPELLAPAGDWNCAKAAVENGADAIYFGLDKFNARMRAENFTEEDLPELMAWLHRRGVKGYVTFNTLTFTDELADAERYLRAIVSAGVDAAIVQDVGICRLIRHLSPDFPIHVSTQMTVTSAVGVEFARSLGCNLVVLARECSLKEIDKIQAQLRHNQADTGGVPLPLEVFVHGALCVAYSGQCLTSEALGGRSANRGECAQACRMTYELIADGKTVPLGDRQYLLSPQDLSGLSLLPELVQAGVASLKIEGRLKTPEYVANVTRVYREGLDRVMTDGTNADVKRTYRVSQSDRYSLEMSFSRGLYSGWLAGIDNQSLVHARFGKKRGVLLGKVTRIQGERVEVVLEAPLKAGDGVLFEGGRSQRDEQGGRVRTIDFEAESVTPMKRAGSRSSGRKRSPKTAKKRAWLRFGKGTVDFRKVRVGDRLWKTSDPELERTIRQSYAGDRAQFKRPIDIEISGKVGEPLRAIARDRQGHESSVESTLPVEAARKQPLDANRLATQFGRLGNTPFELGQLEVHLQGDCLVPVSELNRMRRSLVEQLEAARSQPLDWQLSDRASYRDLLPARAKDTANLGEPQLVVMSRTVEQLEAAWSAGIETLYCEFEDPRRYREAVRMVKANPTAANQTIWVAPPRITKPLENWILKQVRSSEADGYLVRNFDHLEFFAGDRCIGDFSLNVANPIAANYFKTHYTLERMTASYDLDIDRLEDLLEATPANWFDIAIHQHMPMFHMEHCVFCAFLSEGTDYTNCGRPCETHKVKLRDRVGSEHVLQADAGCRNTLFNGTAQTGAEYVERLLAAGARHFRIDFLDESARATKQAIVSYCQLLRGEISGTQLWRELQLTSQLGVTRGTLQR